MRPRSQRISPVAPRGTLLKCLGAPARRPTNGADDRDAAYLALVRQCPCLYCGLDPAGEAAHVRLASAAFGKASGLGKKPPDRFAVPLCADDHRLARHAQHNRSERAFWASLGINPLIVCERLYARRDDLIAMRAAALLTIMGRDTAFPELPDSRQRPPHGSHHPDGLFHSAIEGSGQ